jgi:hypothetical protein
MKGVIGSLATVAILLALLTGALAGQLQDALTDYKVNKTKW